MLQPAKIDISADRWAMCRRTFAFVGYDFTSVTALKTDIRLTNDATGSALVTLTKQTTDVQGLRLTYAGTDTVANHLGAGRLSQADVNALLASENVATGVNFALTDSILLSIIAMRIDKTTMDALPFPVERGDDVTLAWDLHITPNGGDEDRYAGGAFIVRAGATQ